MDIVERDAWVDMVREDLERFPHYPVPTCYSVRWHRSGDEELWREVWGAAESRISITPELFEGEFGHTRELLGDRQFFLLDAAGEAIGTATAWFDADYHGQPFGRVHWVALVPRAQGQGLSKSIMTITLEQLRKLGHVRACLTTSTSRLAAINLYREFGFVPGTHTEDDLAVWRQLQPHLKRKLRLAG